MSQCGGVSKGVSDVGASAALQEGFPLSSPDATRWLKPPLGLTAGDCTKGSTGYSNWQLKQPLLEEIPVSVVLVSAGSLLV
ncbi:MAG: hypothetical protein KME30_06885 [Iphinoe sp. HA4291-MV1]|nr:hypothetical protein [Iphinoe sp. HA4291-MV1]